jgi:hypothetical protein
MINKSGFLFVHPECCGSFNTVKYKLRYNLFEELTCMACEKHMYDEAQDKESHRRYIVVKRINTIGHL